MCTGMPWGIWEGTRTLYMFLFVKNTQMIKKHLFWLKCHMVYLWVLQQGKCKLYNSKYKNIFIQLGCYLLQKKTKMTSMILVSDLWFYVLLVRRYGCPYMNMSNMPLRHKGVEVLLHSFSTSALHGSGWTCWRESWLDPSANLFNLDKWNISCLCHESNLHFSVIQSLYRFIVALSMQFVTYL